MKAPAQKRDYRIFAKSSYQTTRIVAACAHCRSTSQLVLFRPILIDGLGQRSRTSFEARAATVRSSDAVSAAG